MGTRLGLRLDFGMPAKVLATAFVLLAASFAGAGELAVLHSVLAEIPDASSAPVPCEGAANLLCAPGTSGSAPVAEVPRALRIGIETTPCYLGCAAFTAIFSSDGSFTYVGEMNVEHMGEHSGRVDVAALHQVMRLAEQVGFERLDDTYATPYLDNPSSYVMVEWPDETKVVRADGGAEPATFWAIRELLIGLLEDAAWDVP